MQPAHSLGRTARKWMYVGHLWIGIILSIYFTALGLTGSGLMFKTELHHLFKHKLHYVEVPPNKHWASLDKIAMMFEYAKNSKVASMTLPMHEGETLVIGYQPPVKPNGQKNDWRQCYVNPYTGALVGDEVVGGQPFRWLLQLHAKLLLEDVGAKLNACGVFVLVILLISGLYLWCPSPKHFWQQFKQRTTIRKGVSLGRMNFDIHNAVGFYSSALLLVFALTAISHFWHQQALAVVSALTGTTVEQAERKPMGNATAFSYDKVLQASKDLVPGYKPAIITDNMHVLMAEPEGHMVFPTLVNVAFDKETGAVDYIEKSGEQPINAQIMNWMMPIHYGHFGVGIFYFVIKTIWFLAGLCPLILSITGVLMYVLKLRSKREKRTNTAGDKFPGASDLHLACAKYRRPA